MAVTKPILLAAPWCHGIPLAPEAPPWDAADCKEPSFTIPLPLQVPNIYLINWERPESRVPADPGGDYICHVDRQTDTFMAVQPSQAPPPQFCCWTGATGGDQRG